FKTGTAENVRGVLTDKSRLTGVHAVRENGQAMRLSDGWYSPCKPCEDDPQAPLTWQLRAREVINDEVEQNVIYHHAFLDFLGIPIFYTPYFSHPSPQVKRRSGFLTSSVL